MNGLRSVIWNLQFKRVLLELQEDALARGKFEVMPTFNSKTGRLRSEYSASELLMIASTY